MPNKSIGIDNHWPIERFKKSKPKNESGSLVNSIKNLNVPYSIKNKAAIWPAFLF